MVRTSLRVNERGVSKRTLVSFLNIPVGMNAERGLAAPGEDHMPQAFKWKEALL
jgi:hypothetical protein